MEATIERTVEIATRDGDAVHGDLAVPDASSGLVVFAHGSGSSRFSPRNREVAEQLRARSLGTLLMDLLTPDEDEIDRVTRQHRFDIPVLAGRLVAALAHLATDDSVPHARFGLWADGAVARIEVVATARFPDFAAAVRHYLADVAEREHPVAAAVCAAGPVADGEVALTNCPWRLSGADIAAAAGTDAVVLVNDFEALAWALPVLGPADLRPLGGPPPAPRRGRPALAVLGPGTGLGVGGLVPDRAGGYAAVAGEGGHVTVPVQDEREAALVADLRARHGHVSAERVLSGPGIVEVYQALARLDGAAAVTATDPAAVSARAASGDRLASEALGLFAGWLGTVAGDLALTLGARGGVFVAGGIVPRLGAAFDAARFRARFEAKGRFAAYLRPVPTALVVAPYPAFLGLAALVGSPAARIAPAR